MMYLTIAVLCSVAVSVLLKILRQRNIDIRQTIVAGYPDMDAISRLMTLPKEAGARISEVVQREARRDPIGKGGVVRDPAVHREVLVAVTSAISWARLAKSALKTDGTIWYVPAFGSLRLFIVTRSLKP